jgi:hypothetical protein
MTAGLITLREEIMQPLPLAYHPLYRFYEGGSRTRRFRGLPESPDDWWSEDWVGSCTSASNAGPDGRTQGLSTVELPGAGQPALSRLGRTRTRPGRPLPRAERGITGPLPSHAQEVPDARFRGGPARGL